MLKIYIHQGPSWSCSHGSWIYNYLSNKCLSPLTLWVRIPLRQCVIDTTLLLKVALITLNPSVKEYSLQGWTYFCAENIWEKTFKTKQPRLERRKQKNRLIIYLSSRQFGMTGCTSRDNKLYKHHLLYVVNIYVLVLVLHSVKDMISFTTRKNPLFSIWTLISTYYMYSTSVQQSSSSSTYSNY